MPFLRTVLTAFCAIAAIPSLSAQEAITLPGRDGLTIKAKLYRPALAPGRPLSPCMAVVARGSRAMTIGATGSPVPDFSWSSLTVSARAGSAPSA
jgi:hypothetical protein